MQTCNIKKRKCEKDSPNHLNQPKISAYFTFHNQVDGRTSSTIIQSDKFDFTDRKKIISSSNHHLAVANIDQKASNRRNDNNGSRGNHHIDDINSELSYNKLEIKYDNHPYNRNNQVDKHHKFNDNFNRKRDTKDFDIDNYLDESANVYHKHHLGGEFHVIDIAGMDAGFESKGSEYVTGAHEKPTTGAFNVRDFIAQEASKNLSIDVLTSGSSVSATSASMMSIATTNGYQHLSSNSHTNIGELFEDISVDTFYASLFQKNLHDLLGGSINRGCVEPSDFAAIEFRTRYMNEQQYITTYETMLLHEVKAAISQALELLQGTTFSASAIDFTINDTINNSNNNNSNQENYSYKNSNKRQYNKSSVGTEQKFQTLHCTSVNKRMSNNGTSSASSPLPSELGHLFEVTLSSSSSSPLSSCSNSSSSSGSDIRNGSSTSVIELHKDDLVVVVKRNSSDTAAISKVNKENNSSNKSWTLDEISRHRHTLAVVLSVNNSVSSYKTASGDSSQVNKNLSYDDSSTCTLLVLQPSTQQLKDYNNKLRVISDGCYDVMSLTSLSTFTREWVALHSIVNHKLMPLTPYILKSSPVISASRLEEINESIVSRLRTIDHLKRHSSVTKEIQTSREDSALHSLLDELDYLDTIQVDGSVLLNTNLVKTLTSLKSNSDAFLEVVRTKSIEIVKKWKAQIKIDNKISTLRNMKGGNVAVIPPDSHSVDCPVGVSSQLWNHLCRTYNNSQLYAIKYVSDILDTTQDTRVALVQGPPGTGKSYTILGMISALLHKDGATSSSSDTRIGSGSKQNRILLCAPSNAAVDQLLTRLQEHGLADSTGQTCAVKMVRMGDSPGCPQHIRELSLEYQTEEKVKRSDHWLHFQSHCGRIELLMKSLRELELSAGHDKNVLTDKETKTIKNELYSRRRERTYMISAIERYRIEVRRNLIYDAEIVVSTLSSSGKQIFLDHIIRDDLRFETALIDEAAQATEPSCLIPLRYGCRRLVLVGDPRQLPATVLSQAADKLGLGVSLFERLERSGHPLVMLTTQYRMMPEIRLFPSTFFYQGKLTDSDSVNIMASCSSQLPFPTSLDIPRPTLREAYGSALSSSNQMLQIRINPIIFYDLSSSQEVRTGMSYCNHVEVDFIFALVSALSLLPRAQAVSIGIISSYKAQVNAIKNKLLASRDVRGKSSEILDAHTSIRQAFPDLEVNTVDGFQGKEKDVIIFSCVRTGGVNEFNGRSNGIGFLDDEKRVNVAITRARFNLLMVGKSSALNGSRVWNSLLISLRNRNFIQKIEYSKDR